ncbi:dynein heavy chain, putative [Perkinsus marinus ATCC 50983]|uniref:Dynein heavy chain, putative n=1 Tax=Perkinsus marinus (strain ATCC 50983 / TXsc) TaxID=423536 RepID=C5LBP4_PERM5|nr:dynein heavy chain, putative [Perkinsus marinus ATCC 50983]EER05865.1 dynein heavy chain, putative [Perkinsus marinus ATCC 50983]|eukprot:XP_002774049.1 dynein heavy chain, putative [Perkinsus marinus ATCC 50983]
MSLCSESNELIRLESRRASEAHIFNSTNKLRLTTILLTQGFRDVDRIKKIKELLAKDKDVFEGDNTKNISKAGFGLLQWVKAMIKYHERINEELRTLAENIERLSKEEVEQSAVLKSLEEEAEAMQRKLEAASKLIDGLASERKRWSTDITLQGDKKVRLVGDCLLGSAFISYAGPFNHQFRNEMLYGDWLGRVVEADIPTSRDFKLEALLTSDVEVTLWSSQGLPSDELSVQNGILTTRTNRFPLCVDPQVGGDGCTCRADMLRMVSDDEEQHDAVGFVIAPCLIDINFDLEKLKTDQRICPAFSHIIDFDKLSGF